MANNDCSLTTDNALSNNTPIETGRRDRKVLEFEPVQTDHQTELKIPYTDSHTVSPMFTPNRYLSQSYFDENNIDDDEYECDNIDKFADGGDEKCYENEGDDDICMRLERLRELPECANLLKLSRELPCDMFVDRLLLDSEQSETKLEEIRSKLFELLRSDDTFPFGSNCDLKRRLNTRNGDSACVKLAYDVHSLLLVLDGTDPFSIKHIISISKKQPRISSVSKATPGAPQPINKCSCSVEVSQLKDMFSSVQADILLVKQRQAAAENLRSADIKNLRDSIKGVHEELSSANENLKICVDQLTERISSTENASKVQINKTNSFVSSNSNGIIELQQSVINVSASLDQMKNKLEEALANTSAAQPTANVENLTTGDQPTRRDVPCVDQLITNTTSESQQPRSYADVVTMPKPNTSSANLIDFECQAQSHLFPSSEVLNPTITSDAKEDDSCFGNAKIPTRVTARKERKSRNRRQRNGREINFAIIRREVEEASAQQERMSSFDHAGEYQTDYSQNNDYNDFSQYVRKRTKRYFVSGFIPSITETKIAQYVRGRGLKVTQVTIFRKNRNDDVNVVIRVNVEDDGYTDAMIEDPFFWPRGVICRPWLSQRELRQRRQSGRRRYRHGAPQHGYEQRAYMNSSENEIEFQNRYSVLDTDCDVD